MGHTYDQYRRPGLYEGVRGGFNYATSERTGIITTVNDWWCRGRWKAILTSFFCVAFTLGHHPLIGLWLAAFLADFVVMAKGKPILRFLIGWMVIEIFYLHVAGT